MLRSIFAPARFTGWHMAGVLGLFFGTIILVNATLAIFASGTWTGLVVKNSYVASQHFNESMAAAEEQAALGWSGRLALHGNRLEFRLTDADGAPVAVERVVASLGRPAHEGADHDVLLAPLGDGAHGATDVLAPGPWKADLVADLPGGGVWRMRYRFTAK
ncbi:FixH family protein [Marivibrio halodurans]|uniref:FixH family protein n=1 Tax=Marivibrio halodurans TaxID=2039722 RepID=A0A8J7V3R9_9PROT|nr:FixH family protein [Marivibrio halodurans]MBP5858675.1 FixH family protein [Marivibrio halodurans]